LAGIHAGQSIGNKEAHGGSASWLWTGAGFATIRRSLASGGTAMANATNYDWRTIGLWVVVAIVAVLVIAWLAGAFERTAEVPPPEAPPAETTPQQPQPDTTPPAPQQ
jgi:hypothetical protein